MRLNKVVISGLTAAGKTTQAGVLANAVGCKAVHAADLVLEIAGFPEDRTGGPWRGRMREFEALRDGAVDDRVEKELLTRCHSYESLVIDSWTLPWLCPENALRIWIGSDRLSRSWKNMISSDMRLTTEEAASHIDEKDAMVRDRFLDRYGLDMFSDRSVFDFVLDGSHTFVGFDEESRKRGVSILGRAVLACVEAGLFGDYSRAREIHRDESGVSSCLAGVGARFRERWHAEVRRGPAIPALPSRVV